MLHPKPIQIIDLAIRGAYLRIGDLQNEILLLERFGNKAMINHNFYHTENFTRNEDLYNQDEIKKEIDELINLSAELEKAREVYFDKKFEEGINQYFDEKN